MKIKTYIYLLILLLVYLVVFYLQPQICFAQKPLNKFKKNNANQIEVKDFEKSIEDKINKLNQTETDLKTKLAYLEKLLKDIEDKINEDESRNTSYQNRSILAFIISMVSLTTIIICLLLFTIKLYPRLEDYVIQIKLTSDQLKPIKEEIVDLNNQISNQKKTDIDLKNQINSQSSKNSKLIQEQVQTHLNGYLDDYFSDLHKEYVDLQVKVNENDASILKSELKKLEDKLDDYFSDLHKEYVDLQVKVNQSDTSTLKSELKKLEDKYESLLKEISGLKKNKKNLNNSYKLLEKDVSIAIRENILTVNDYKSEIKLVALAKLDDARKDVLVEDSNGLFCIGSNKSTKELVAIPNREKVQSAHQFDPLERFYSCTSQAKTGNIMIVKPAIVSTTPGVQEWWLEEKGVLEII